MAANIAAKSTLAEAADYRSELAGAGSSSGPILFGPINRLVRRGDQMGLLDSLGLTDAKASLTQISAAGLASTRRKSQTTAELYFTIS
jgi:hypothetical protein